KLRDRYDKIRHHSAGDTRGGGESGVPTGTSRLTVAVDPSAYVNVNVTLVDSPAGSSVGRPTMARYIPPGPGVRTSGPLAGTGRLTVADPADVGDGAGVGDGEPFAFFEAETDGDGNGDAEGEPNSNTRPLSVVTPVSRTSPLVLLNSRRSSG